MSMEYIESDLTAGQKIVALDAIIEPLEYHLENTPNEFINWEDFTMQLADDIVPIWNAERVQWWLDMGMPESDDYSRGIGEGVLDEITYAIYIAVEQFLRNLIEGAEVDSDIKFAENVFGGTIVPNAQEVLNTAVKYRKQFGVARGYDQLAEAILK